MEAFPKKTNPGTFWQRKCEQSKPISSCGRKLLFLDLGKAFSGLVVLCHHFTSPSEKWKESALFDFDKYEFKPS
jgi:hypothetical protein